MPKNPLISVITVVYNGKNDLCHAIQSVIKQSYENIEYIIIDGGSTDGTIDVIKQYDTAISRWISEPDGGVYDAMNKGVSISKGDYILFLGCDDRLFDVLHEVVDFFLDKNTSYYGNVVLSKGGEVYGGKFYPLKLFAKNIPHQAVFYSRFVFDDYEFSTKYVAVADYELNLKLYSDKNLGLKYIPKTIAKYNNEDGLSSIVVDHSFSLDKPGIIRAHYSLIYYVAYMTLRFFFKSR
ncbi:MAG: glycosyltransferase family 2 protein [Gammaproteobacteria bacterium]|nr:glycosyltransferase family 2 protein [Gammaproteobacteria bacterium]